MSILSDADIISAVASKDLDIAPFREDHLTPNGYDLTIAQVVIPNKSIDIKAGSVDVPPQTWFAISTEEYVKFGPKYGAGLWIRTSYARRGIISSFGKIDAGFEGTLTLNAFNGSDKPVTIEISKTFAQMVIEPLVSPPKGLYKDRSGNYQGQKGVKLVDTKH